MKHTPAEWREHVREFRACGYDPYNSFDAPEVWYLNACASSGLTPGFSVCWGSSE